jgi:hypothetical protein
MAGALRISGMGGYAYPDEVTAERLRLAPGLTLVGEDPGQGSAEDRFLVRRGDGQAIWLAQLPFQVTVAIAEAAMATGARGRGVSAQLIAVQLNEAIGPEVTAAMVGALVAGQLAPLGVVIAAPTGPAPASPAPASPAPAATGPAPAPAARSFPVMAASQAPAEAPVQVPVPAPAPAPAASEPPPRKHPRRRTVALGALGVVAVAGTAVAAVALTRSGPPASISATTAQARAASWVAQQVSPGAMVSCDQVTCGLARRDGFPSGQLETLHPATRDPLGSAVVIATPAVRAEFGSRLATVYAPMVIAAFGAGSNRVEVRAIAPDGAGAFTAALDAQRASLISSGRQLLGNTTIQASRSARADLLAGRVDPRLLAILSVLSSQRTVRLEAFDDASPGVSAVVPLRSVMLGASTAAERSTILAFLDAQQGTYRPDMMAATSDASGQPAVVVRFDAPDPVSTP